MQDNSSAQQLTNPNLSRINAEYDDGARKNQFISLQVTSAGQDDNPGKSFKRPGSSMNQNPMVHPALSPSKNTTSGSPLKLQRIKIMNQTQNSGQFKLSVPQLPPQHLSNVSSASEYNTQQQTQSAAGIGNFFQSHQKPPTHGYNSASHGHSLTNVPTRIRSPNIHNQDSHNRLQPVPNLPPPNSTGQNKSLVGKIKIQSNSLNRIQNNDGQKNGENSGTLQSTRNMGSSGLAGVSGGLTSASGSQLCRPIIRTQTNNLISAGATIMANSPHHNHEEKFKMPSISDSGNNSQKRIMYRSRGRVESCEKTINNTLDSILELNHKEIPPIGPNNVNPSDASNFQNFQAMQMAIHNSQQRLPSNQGSRTRISTTTESLVIKNSRYDTMQSRTSLPIIGRVNATNDSRTGILTKTQNLIGHRDGSGSTTRVSYDKVNQQTAGTTPQTRRGRSGSHDRKIISRVSSRFTDVSKAIETDKYSDSFTSDDGDDEAVVQKDGTKKQQSVLQQMLKTEENYPHALAHAGSATTLAEESQIQQSKTQTHSIVNQLIQKDKEKELESARQHPEGAPAPKIVGVGGKVPALAQDVNAPKGKKNQPFDFNFIKIIIKRSSNDKEKKEVFLDRNWVQKRNNVPHFANVIKNVDKNEGVEITMNCNKAAFNWLMDFVSIKSNTADHIDKVIEENGYITSRQREMIEDDMDVQLHEHMDMIDLENCLNILVTSYFLQLYWAYEKVWTYYFKRNFSDVVNQCNISLSNINPAIVRHIAERIGDESMEELKERKDKFISNVYKEKINFHIHMEGGSQMTQAESNYQVPALADMDEDEKQELKKAKQLYWCARCKNLLTKEQAAVISCAEPPALDDLGQPNCALGTDIFDFYKSRVNPLCFAPSSIFQSMLLNEQKEKVESRKSSQKKSKQNQNDPELSDNDDGFIHEHGQNHFHHDLIFEEDVPRIVEFMSKLPPEQRKPIKVSVPVDLTGFVKFFREQFRLCWKEIYLKIHALVYRPEQCKKCRKFFQIANFASCTMGPPIEEDEEEGPNLNSKFRPVYFHEVDHSEREIQMYNQLTNFQLKIFQQEVQVIDNQKPCYKMTQKTIDSGKKGKNQIEVLMDQHKGTIEFIEPQSMNYDTKISDAYVDYLFKLEKSSKNINKQKTIHDQPVVYANGDKYEYIDDTIDDLLYKIPKAQKKINKKLKDHKFMDKLQKKCEDYVRDNPEEFCKAKKQKFKMDIVDNKIFDLDDNKKKKKKDELDEVQQAEVQNLVIKRFRRVRKDIIMDDDEQCMQTLMRELAMVREQQAGTKPQRNQSSGGNRQSSQNPKGQSGSTQQPGKQLGLQRQGNKSPQANQGNSKGDDFAAQAGVKIYSDIKQITAKKNTTKKAPLVIKGGEGVRRNFMQRNVARSTGARSGSNNNKGNSQNLMQAQEPTIVPVLNNNVQGHRNSSNPSKRKQSNSMVFIDDQKDAVQASHTPVYPHANNLKTRSIIQTNSATRVQANQTSFNLDGANGIQLPANNYINQSQDQLQTSLDGQYQIKERSLNQRRPLRSPGDSMINKNMVGQSMQSLDHHNQGPANSGRTQQLFQGLTGTAYPIGQNQGGPTMKLNVPQAFNRSVIETGSGENVSTGGGYPHKANMASRSGSQGGSIIQQEHNTSMMTSLNVPTQNPNASAPQGTGNQQVLRIHKSPGLKIRASKIEKAQTLLKMSQQKNQLHQNNT